MIIGIGQDMCDIRRIEKSIAEFGERFTHRVFTEVERRTADRRKERAPTYAKRFAAKEACAKALGTGVPRRGVHWTHMGVVNLPSGKPTFALTGGAAERLANVRGLLEMDAEHMAFADGAFDIAVAMFTASVVPDSVEVSRSEACSRSTVCSLPLSVRRR